MRLRTRPHANRSRREQLERGGCGPVKRIGWILAGAVLTALLSGANPSAAATVASSPVNARLAVSPGSHLTSARVHHASHARSPRSSSRSIPARHASSRAHSPIGAPRAHRASSRLNRHPHGRWNGHGAATAVSGDARHLNSATQVEVAWLRAPRQLFTAAPETRGPPRASPQTNIRPQPSPSRLRDCSSRLGRAPSLNLPTSFEAPSPSLCRTQRVWRDRHPHARLFEGTVAWHWSPSGGILS